MSPSPKARLLLLALTGAVLTGVLAWSLRPGSTGYATPAECLEAYREACRTGDTSRYLRCLGEPLRSELRRTCPDDEVLAEALRLDARGVKGWVDLGPPEEQGERALAGVEEVRQSGQRRLRFHLEHSPDGWLIVRVEKEPERTPEARYGARVGEENGTR